ncbi:hypothetical protein [Bradyrhizobium manausense]|nr:hypothetical protein [Bradyrhizobium manausense]
MAVLFAQLVLLDLAGITVVEVRGACSTMVGSQLQLAAESGR